MLAIYLCLRFHVRSFSSIHFCVCQNLKYLSKFSQKPGQHWIYTYSLSAQTTLKIICLFFIYYDRKLHVYFYLKKYHIYLPVHLYMYIRSQLNSLSLFYKKKSICKITHLCRYFFSYLFIYLHVHILIKHEWKGWPLWDFRAKLNRRIYYLVNLRILNKQI